MGLELRVSELSGALLPASPIGTSSPSKSGSDKVELFHT